MDSQTPQSDLENPDETRPVKRARLDASLSVTDDVRKEMMDEDDWDDVYGNSSLRTSNTADPVPDRSSSLNAASETTALPALLPSEPHHSTTAISEHSVDNEVQPSDSGLPAEVISSGDDLVAPSSHAPIDNNDNSTHAVIEKTTQVEHLPPVDSNGKQVADDVHWDIGSESRKETAQPLDLLDQLMADADAVETRSKPAEDAEFKAAATAQKTNEEAEWQYDTSDADSSSDSDSSDSSNSDSDDDEALDPATLAKMLMDGDDENEGGGGKNGANAQPRTSNEVQEEVIPKPDITILPDTRITFLGTVETMVENLVLVKGATPGEYQVLEPGSALCNEKRDVLGVVHDTLGKVQEPLYSIAFTNEEEIKVAGLEFGTKIFYVDEHSTFVFTQPLKNIKGTDASNIHDEEIGEDEAEFSDDEAEAEYKRQRKLAKKTGRGNLSRGAFQSGERESFDTSNMPFGHSDAPAQDYGGGLSYDDGETAEDFYQPLKRPDNLNQLMSEGKSSRSRPQSDRGRGRGRGDRGRGSGRDERRRDRPRGRGGSDQRFQSGASSSGPTPQYARGSAHKVNFNSFPDRHNNDWERDAQHALPYKPTHTLPPKPTAPPAEPSHPYYQQSVPQTYQFNGQTYQYGNQGPSAMQYGYQGQQQQQQQIPLGNIPSGAYVNPALYQQGQPQQHNPFNYAPNHQQQQYHHVQSQPEAPRASIQNFDLGSLLARLGPPSGTK